MWYNQSTMPSIVAHPYNLYTQKQKQVSGSFRVWSQPSLKWEVQANQNYIEKLSLLPPPKKLPALLYWWVQKGSLGIHGFNVNLVQETIQGCIY